MILFWDSETYPIQPGLAAPPVVCGQWRESADGPIHVAHAPAALARLRTALEDPSTIVAGHNIAFDMAAAVATDPRLFPLVFRAADEDRIVCTMVREKVLQIARGRARAVKDWGLLSTLNRHKIPHDFRPEDKDSADTWRTRYSELVGVPVEAWPADALRYAREDVAHGHALIAAQNALVPPAMLADEHRQARASIWLYLLTCHGVRTDPEAVQTLRIALEREYADLRAKLTAVGLVSPKGTRSEAAAKARMVRARLHAGLPIPITKTGLEKVAKDSFSAGSIPPDQLKYVGLTADACLETGDPILVDYARFGSIRSNLLARVDRLSRAGSMPIQFGFDVLKETGRTSCRSGKPKPGKPISTYGDQGQNLNRDPGVRECYRPRPGHLFLSVDWSSAELHTLAEVCVMLGLDSVLARELNSGRDVHLSFGASMNGWTYEWAKEHKKDPAVKDARQFGKVGNFGLPGGLGALKLRLWAAKVYGLILSQDQAETLKRGWLGFFTEMPDYFRHVNDLIESGRPLVHVRSGRYRGDIRYTSACNSYFQGLAADMAKAVGWELARECYLGGGPLWGARLWNFVHDEYLLEVPEDRAHEMAIRASERMATLGSEWTPHVPVHAEPALSRRWRKGAEPTYRDGVLIPWEDRDPSPEDPERARELKDKGLDPVRISWELGYEPERIREWISAP